MRNYYKKKIELLEGALKETREICLKKMHELTKGYNIK
jgi:hypothetical protein